MPTESAPLSSPLRPAEPGPRSRRLAESLAAKVRAANAALLVEGDAGAIGELFAPSYVAHLTGKDAKGHAWVRRYLRRIHGAFERLAVDVEVLVEAKDRVAWQRTIRAKHVADFEGFPATGRRVVWRDQITSRFEDGRIAEEWAVSDLAERLLRARRTRAR